MRGRSIEKTLIKRLYLLLPFFLFVSTNLDAQKNKTRKPQWILQDSCDKYLFVDQKKCIEFGKQSAELSIKAKDYVCQGGAYNFIGNAYHVQGDYANAYAYYNKALNVFEKHKIQRGIISTYVNLGIVHMDQQNYALARKNYKLGIKKALQEKDSANLGNLYNNLGVVYNKENKLDSSLICHFAALDIRRAFKNTSYIASSLSNIGVVYFEKGEFDKSMQYHLEAMKTDSTNATTVVYANLAATYLHQKNHSKALYYANKAMSLGEENIERQVLVDLYAHLFKIHAARNNYGVALEFAEKALALKDSLSAEETKRIVTEAAEKFESEKKELEIQNLSKDKEAQAARLQKQNVQTIALAAGFLFVLVFLVLVYRGYKQKQKANEEILHQKHLVEEKAAELSAKQKEIIDSINYAKKIQDAYLPTEGTFHHVFNNAFLLFQPKDVVSGDFYWFYSLREQDQLTDTVLFAVADCTGHGVPGALMSVVCCNALNEVVIRQKTDEPGKILDEAREIVIRSLKSKVGSGQKDGMDITLCKLNRTTGELWYAGANNPLWIIGHNGEGYTLLELKPDKQPVGIFDHQQPFRTQYLKLNKGDMVYAFSDGYPDQFGGPKGKKFKYAGFQELLLKNAGLTMEEQYQALLKNFEGWRGDLEQVDDICVMGIRVGEV